jgi:hypothetical protein
MFVLLGLIGMSACMYVLDDFWRFMYIELLARTHRITMSRVVEAHCRLMTKYGCVDLTVDELVETVIEVSEPFFS